VVAVVRRAMEKKPTVRYQSAREMIDDLDAASSWLPPGGRRSP
jgi:hypothetical protein